MCPLLAPCHIFNRAFKVAKFTPRLRSITIIRSFPVITIITTFIQTTVITPTATTITAATPLRYHV